MDWISTCPVKGKRMLEMQFVTDSGANNSVLKDS